VAVVAVGHAWHGEALHSVSPFLVIAGFLKLTRRTGRVGTAFNVRTRHHRPSSRLECQEAFCGVTSAGFTHQLGKPCTTISPPRRTLSWRHPQPVSIHSPGGAGRGRPTFPARDSRLSTGSENLETSISS